MAEHSRTGSDGLGLSGRRRAQSEIRSRKLKLRASLRSTRPHAAYRGLFRFMSFVIFMADNLLKAHQSVLASARGAR